MQGAFSSINHPTPSEVAGIVSRTSTLMDMIFDELRKNSIEMERCLGQHKFIYDCLVEGAEGMFLNDVYQKMNPNNFGQIMAYLALVLRVSDSLDDETIGEAVRNTTEHFKEIDLSKYGRKFSWIIWLTNVYQEMNPNNFGRIMANLALVLRVSDFCNEETIREAVRNTAEHFEEIDLSKHVNENLAG